MKGVAGQWLQLHCGNEGLIAKINDSRYNGIGDKHTFINKRNSTLSQCRKL